MQVSCRNQSPGWSNTGVSDLPRDLLSHDNHILCHFLTAVISPRFRHKDVIYVIRLTDRKLSSTLRCDSQKNIHFLAAGLPIGSAL